MQTTHTMAVFRNEIRCTKIKIPKFFGNQNQSKIIYKNTFFVTESIKKKEVRNAKVIVKEIHIHPRIIKIFRNGKVKCNKKMESAPTLEFCICFVLFHSRYTDNIVNAKGFEFE